MRNRIGIILLVVCAVVLVISGHHDELTRAPESTDEAAIAIPVYSAEMTTDTWGIFNPETGEIIAGRNVGIEHAIASVTKLFTAYAVLESEKKEAPVTVLWSDLNAEGRAGKLRYGQQLKLDELLFPLLLESSNDAGEAISRSLGSEFKSSVESLKTELALDHTYINDATGLSDLNVSNINDLAKFYAHLKAVHPRISDITQLRLYIGDEVGWVNNDPARALSNFTGGKHGFTDTAGRTFVGTFARSSGDTDIGIILLGSTNLTSDITTALNYVENHPTLSICYNAGTCPRMQEVVTYDSEAR